MAESSSKSVFAPRKRGQGAWNPDTWQTALPFKFTFEGKSWKGIATSVDFGEGDTHTVVTTLGTKNYIYVTGLDPVPVTISGYIIYPKCGGGSSLKSWWDKNRCSTKQAPVTMTLHQGKTYKIYVTNFACHGDSKTDDMETFTIKGIGVEA